MLTAYINAAMQRATYELLSDGTFYAEIPGFDGVYANEANLEQCRQTLQEVLEGWIVLGLRLGHTLPQLGNISLTPELQAASLGHISSLPTTLKYWYFILTLWVFYNSISSVLKNFFYLESSLLKN